MKLTTNTQVPTRHGGGGERLVPQVFVKPGSEAVATMNFIVTPMATSAVFKKLDQEAEAAPGKDDDKVKGKGKKRSGRSKPAADDQQTTPTQWSNLAHPIPDPFSSMGHEPPLDASRPKTALDDFMNIFCDEVKRARAKVAGQKAEAAFQESVLSIFRHAFSCFCEFSWTGSVALNGKFSRVYSAFRPELETFLRTALELASASNVPSKSGDGKGLTLLADFALDLDPGLQIGHIPDDEEAALQRIKVGVPMNEKSGMGAFISDTVTLPLEYHGNFAKATWTWTYFFWDVSVFTIYVRD